MSARPRRCGVLGKPVAHSLSPALHRAAYAELGLDWEYDAVEVGADDLAPFIAGLGPEWRGLSLTMPLKRTVLPLLDSGDHWATLSGAANTVVLDGAGGRHGANTDVPGAVAALRERTSTPLRSAVVVGGGATAASVLLALAELGLERATLLVREPARAEPTLASVARHPAAPRVAVERLGGPVPEADIAVSTVPADAQEPGLVSALAAASVVFEVLYDPWPTPLAAAALSAGTTLVSGLDLLVHQAALQVELMTGLRAPLERMRSSGEATLIARARP
ncbi:MAG TPA: shikimate dehydrogenase [Marmoricola sp.]|nr:shikimate dehydrogenase [Marmoricola sp.]